MESQVTGAEDYYTVLGVARDAGQDEIRKAYRKLARQYHPDLNGGDAAAAERFREVQRAYDVLSDADKRARYDRFGAAGVENGGGAGPDFGMGGMGGMGGFGDIFDMFFGAAARGAAAERGPEAGADLRADIEVTLEEVLSGVKKTIPVTRLESCEGCKGSGARPGTQPQKCVACGGRGAVQTSRQTIFGAMTQVVECYRCHGRGEIVTDPCGRCGGRGTERQTRRIEVEIPAGVEERTRLRMRGEGEAGPHGGPPGDLYIFIHVKQHPVFRRRGRDLVSEIDVSLSRAALGGAVEVRTLEGTETITLPAGTQYGDSCRIKGRGLPELTQPQLRGDLHVMMRVKVPTKLNERQRRALEELAEASGEDLNATEPPPPHEKGFFEWVRGLFTQRDEGQHDDER
ncbi:MAG: molecular chaperone DnaJ [Armatimonadota bacterium]